MQNAVSRGAYDVLGLSELANGERFGLEHVCRSQVQPVYLGDHTALCRVLGRFKFFTDTRDHGFGANLLLDGFWEMWLTMIIARAVKPGMVAIDIGANFGYYSVLLGDLVGPAGRLVAVEPNPVAHTLLRQTLALNGLAGRTHLVAAAAGASSQGSSFLWAPQNEPKNAQLVADPSLVDPASGIITEVPNWGLDDALESIGGRVDFIKIDAEGAEDAILTGMTGTLRQQKPTLVLEYNALRYSDPGALIDLLSAIYGTFHAISFEGSLTPVTKETVLTQNLGEDWLLYFSTDATAAMPPPADPKRHKLR